MKGDTQKMEKLNLDGLVFLMDEQLAGSGKSPIDVWEGQLKTEAITLPPDLRMSVEDYINMIIAFTRIGCLRPDEYAHKIIEGNQGLAPTWRYYSNSTALVHEQMVEIAREGKNEDALAAADALTQSFNGIIQKAGIVYEGEMGTTMRYLLDKLKIFPQESYLVTPPGIEPGFTP